VPTGKTRRIAFGGAFAGLALVVSGCASTAERTVVQTLITQAAARAQVQAGGATHSRAGLPELSEASALNDYMAHAELNNSQLEAAFNRWKAALEMVSPACTLPDLRFDYYHFVEQVEARVGPEEYAVGINQAFPWFGKLKLRGAAALEGANPAQQQYEAAKLKLFDEV
jgi:Outer membrane efflux protein